MYRYYLAAKYLLKRPINLLGSIGIMVAVAALIAVGSVFAGFIREVRIHIRSASPALSYLDDSYQTSFKDFEALVAEDPDIKAIAPRIVWDALLYVEDQSQRQHYTRIADRDPRSTNYYRVVGIDWQREQRVSPIRDWIDRIGGPLQGVADLDRPFWVDDDRFVPSGDMGYRDPSIILGRRRTLRSMPPTAVGQRVRLASARLLPGGGIAPKTWPFIVSCVYSSGRFRDIENQTAFVNIETLREIFGQDPDDRNSIDIFNEVSIALHDESRMDEVAARLNAKLAKSKLPGRVVTWEERNKRFLSAVGIENNVMKIVLFVLVVVASFLIFSLLSVMVAQKTKDIGILAALGASRRGVLSIFLWNGAAIACLGTALGLVAGWALVVSLNPINEWLREKFGAGIFPPEIYGADQVPYELEASWFIQVTLGALAIAFVFSLLPALRAARFDPVRAFRYE